MPTILQTKSIYFNDCVLLPKLGKVKSRKDIPNELYRIIVSPMSSIIGETFIIEAARLGLSVTLPRFIDVIQKIKLSTLFQQNKINNKQLCFISIGLNEHEKNIKSLQVSQLSNCENWLIDIANGYIPQLPEAVVRLNNILGKDFIQNLMVGNVITGEGSDNLINKIKPHCNNLFIRVGQGNGCFDGETRILMANGSYKNIKDLHIHDKIIDGEGLVTEVINVKMSGMKRCLKYRHNRFYKPTICTPDHYHYVHDFNHVAFTTWNSCGRVKTAEKMDNYKWKQIQDLRQDTFTFPKNVQFEMPIDFSFTLEEYYKSTRKEENRVASLVDLKPTYDLGYIFGCFLGDGNASIISTERNINNKISKNTSYNLHFYFGINENDIVEKLKKCIKNVLNIECKIEGNKEGIKNILKVSAYHSGLARFLATRFYLDGIKKLPQDLFVNNKEYLKGIMDGLMDSDGHYSNFKKSFANTSMYLIELFNIICFIVNGFLPSSSTRTKNMSKLNNINLENCKPLYEISFSDNYPNHLNDKYQINQLLELSPIDIIEIPTYDIEVLSNTHSFIANNCIVHNSACATSDNAGINRGQITELMECSGIESYKRNEENCFLVSDGGIKNSGYALKAFGAGASYVLMGSYFSKAREAETNIKGEHSYFGCASEKQNKLAGLDKHSEGKENKINKEDLKSLSYLVKELWGGISSGISYSGYASLSEFIGNGIFEIKQNSLPPKYRY